MKQVRAWAGRALAVLLALSGGWLAGRLVAASDDAGSRKPAGKPVRYTEAEYRSATVSVAKRLTASAAQRLRAAVPGSAPVLLVLLHGSDPRSCEDLARQLRELRRRAPAELPMVVWTGGNDTTAIRAFLRREHVAVQALQEVALDSVFGEHRRVITPAALVIGADGTARGVAHSRRFPNSRPRSFAAELDFSPSATEERSGSPRSPGLGNPRP